jgi:hypothetical protein
MRLITSKGYIEVCLTVANPDEPMQKFSTMMYIHDLVDFEKGMDDPLLTPFWEQAKRSLNVALKTYSQSK